MFIDIATPVPTAFLPGFPPDQPPRFLASAFFFLLIENGRATTAGA
jgi:hypothetical protein